MDEFTKIVPSAFIIAHEIDKLRLQIMEDLYINLKKNKKLESIQVILKIATMFWNAFRFDFFFVFLFNIPYLW